MPSETSGKSASSTAGDRRHRSRLGCWTCRRNKVKCNEERPRCERCVRLDRDCDFTPRPRKPYTRRAENLESPGSMESRSPVQTNIAVENTPVESAQSQQTATLDQHHSPGTSFSFIARAPTAPPSILTLSPSDDAAIHAFRSTLSIAVDTKVPEYSGPALIWILAQQSQMVMHMVCALGGRKLCESASEHSISPGEIQVYQSKAGEHYGAGLRLLAAAAEDPVEEAVFNNILATLWLMISYEQKYGDGSGTGLNAHLQGAALMLQGQLRSRLRKSDDHRQQNPQLGSILDRNCNSLSPLTCRMIVWIASIDGGAALNGLGGAFNDILGDILFDSAQDATMSRIKVFAALEKRATFSGQEIWGSSYPQSQLIEDLQCSQIRCLDAESGQLRFLLSKISVDDHGTTLNDSVAEIQTLACALQDLQSRYSELLQVASHLELPSEGPQRRYVRTVRSIVPLYHATMVCFLRITSGTVTLEHRQQRTIREIMALAFQAHDDEGEQAMVRIAWPLLAVALETDDLVHRSWILDRYETLSKKGEHFRRARDALRVAFSEQGMHGRRIGYSELLQRSDIARFVI